MKKSYSLSIILIIIGMLFPGVVRSQWTLQNNPLGSGESAMLGKIQFVSATEGWIACGSSGSLLHTTNSGTSWTVVTPFPNDNVGNMSDPALSMSWVNPSHGWALKTFGNMNNSNGAVLYNTNDGGSTWNRKVFPNSINTITYNTADLQGTWVMNEVVASPLSNSITLPNQSKSVSSSWAGWVHGTLTLDATGNGTPTDFVKSDGSTDFPSTLSMTITSNGIVSVGGDFHGFMSADKSAVYFTMSDGGGGYALAVMQKKDPVKTFNLSDLQGTWQMHSLKTSSPLSTNNDASWMYGTITLNATGSGSISVTSKDGTDSQNLVLSVSTDGIVTMNGSDFYGCMSSDKKTMNITMTDGKGSSYDLMIMQKVVPATNYSTLDLRGRWQTHILTTVNPSLSLQNDPSGWSYGIITLNAKGQGSANFTDSNSNNNDNNTSENNNNQYDDNVSMSVSSGGIVTMTGSDGNGYMSADKNTIVLTKSEDNGGYTLAVMQKDLSASGDFGLQVQFADDNTGWLSIYNMIYGSFQIYKTTDSGTTWNPMTVTVGGFYYFVDANNGWIVGNSTGNVGESTLNNIYRTSNGGISWTLQASNVGTVKALHFSDLQHGWVVGQDGLVLKTADGGTNWNPVTNTGLTTGSTCKTVFFLDANNGWISGGTENTEGVGTRYVLATKDGGSSWTVQPTPVTNSIFSIFFWDTGNGWLTSDNGQIARYTPPRTLNITAGGLFAALTTTEKNSLTSLSITGTIDARDFKTMRDFMPSLSMIDISGTSIVAYTGTEGTYGTESVTFPANTIPQRAFYNSTTKMGKAILTSIILPSMTVAIDTYAFSATGLTSIALPSSVTTIGFGGFYQCNNLKSVTFGPSPNLQTIGIYAFGLCYQLNSFNVPAQVSSIGDVAFLGTNANVTVDPGNLYYTNFDDALFNKTMTRIMYCMDMKSGNFDIPSSVNTVAVDAFYNCNRLNSITIPSSVTTIEDWAFENCSGLSEISIPSQVTTIGASAFYNCSGLKSIFAHASIPVSLNSAGVFDLVDKYNCILYVPAGTKTLYQASPQWSDFVNILEEGSYVVYNVTVPVNTKACYIAGEMNNWTQQPMNRVDNTHYTINIVGATTAQLYKYCSGPAWSYVEVKTDGSEVSNRQYSQNDVVVKWASVYDPNFVTYHVTVPAGTKACYIAGEMNGWTQQAMTKIDDLNYSITLQGANTGEKYKYCSGPNWNYVELNADNSQVSNRNYSPNDIVAKWTAVYDPSIVPYYLSYNVTVPFGTKSCYISGEMNNYSFQSMSRVDGTHFSITILSHPAYGYKYFSGPDWAYEERNADGSSLSHRSYAVNDEVAQWAAVFDPSSLTGSDYYLPLNTGNYSLLHTSIIPNGSSWGSRNTLYSFIRSESINGIPYFVEQGKDMMDNNPSQIDVFRIFWLRKDDSGNIVAGAYSLNNDDNLATAVILPVPAMIFPNQFLTVNYSQTYPTSGNMIKTDSVVSVSANAGSYSNCIQIRTTVKTNGIITMIEDSYYAYHVGVVMMNRLYPAGDAHTDVLSGFLANEVTGIKETAYNDPSFLYPNPFNDGFYISRGVNAKSVSVYNLNGVLVCSKQISGADYISVSGLPKGMYIARITTQEGIIEKKLIKR